MWASKILWERACSNLPSSDIGSRAESEPPFITLVVGVSFAFIFHVICGIDSTFSHQFLGIIYFKIKSITQRKGSLKWKLAVWGARTREMILFQFRVTGFKTNRMLLLALVIETQMLMRVSSWCFWGCWKEIEPEYFGHDSSDVHSSLGWKRIPVDDEDLGQRFASWKGKD